MKTLINVVNCYWLWFTGALSIITFVLTFLLLVTNYNEHTEYDLKIEKQQLVIDKQQQEIRSLEKIIRK